MNKRFYPVEREAFTIYILVMTPIFFIIAKPTTEVTAIVLAVVFSVLLFINLILFNEHITLTDDVITWQYFWFKKQFLGMVFI